MKRLLAGFMLGLVTLFLTACLTGGGVSVSPQPPTPEPGGELKVGLETGNLAPDFTAEEGFNLEDATLPIKLSDFRGKVVVLNFWASWCGPCRIEMPSLEALWQRYKNEGLVVLTVNRTNSGSETRDKARGYVEGEGFTFPVVFDARGRLGLMYSINLIPTTYILDKNGVIREVVIGAISWDTDPVHDIIEDLLGE